MKNYSAVGGKPYCKAHYPMPTASGTTQETSASVGSNTPAPPPTSQSTEEAFGSNAQQGYEQPGYGDQQYYGEEQHYEQEYQ